MRKYFLLSAVALMAATTANATTDYAEVTAKATIEVAGTFECDDFDWGTIILKQGNEALDIENLDDRFPHPDVISVSGSGFVLCTGGYVNDENVFFDYDEAMNGIVLKNENSDTITLDVWPYDDRYATGTLHIPANVNPGTYTGSFTITHTY